MEVCMHGWVNREGRELAIHGGRLQAGVSICQEAILAGVLLFRLTCTAAHPHNNAGSPEVITAPGKSSFPKHFCGRLTCMAELTLMPHAAARMSW